MAAQYGYSLMDNILFQMNRVCASGILPIWKPIGMGSASAASEIRNALMGCKGYMPFDSRITQKYGEDFRRTRNKMWIKVGHGGTLDRAAEGVLVIGVGHCCSNLEEYLKRKDKSYIFTGKLGATTDTLDSNGVVTEVSPWEHITKESLEEALQGFRGTIDQVPPIFSAKKINGMRMSDIVTKAAKDKSVVVPELPPVQVTIKSLRLLNFNPPFYTVSVSCTSGTYMRSLARDIGKSLGTFSYCTHLSRTAQGEFSEKDALADRDWTYDIIERELRKYHAFSSRRMHQNNC